MQGSKAMNTYEKPKIKGTAEVVKENYDLLARLDYTQRELKKANDAFEYLKEMSILAFIKFKIGR